MVDQIDKHATNRLIMLRIAAKRCYCQGAPPKTGGFTKTLVGLTLVGGTAATSVLGYAYTNPEFRQIVEDNVPQSKQLFKSILGPTEVTYPVQASATPKIEKNFYEDQRCAEDQRRVENQRKVNEEKRDEEQRELNEKAQSHLEAKFRHERENLNAELEERVRDYRQNLDVQYENRIRQTEALHADNLERVVKVLKQVHDAESTQAVEDAVAQERLLNLEQVEQALYRLHGIEVLLSKRVEQDCESRRSKHLWLACQNLSESIIYGQKAGADFEQRRKPLEKEVNTIAKACESDQFVTLIASYFPDVALKSGVYSEEDLKVRFKKVYKIATRTASVDENGGSLFKYLSSWIQSLFIVELPRTFSPEDTLILSELNNREVIVRTRYFVEKGDFLSAVRLAQLLNGEPSRVAKDWIQDTKLHLEARFLADLLLMHSAAGSIRSVY